MILDVHYHNENLISIRKKYDDLNIADKQWDSIFDYCARFEEIYFMGRRAYDFDKQLEINIASHLNEIFANNSNHFEVFAKVNEGSILINRNGVSKLWMYYEFPSFIFCKRKLPSTVIDKFFADQIPYVEIASTLEDALILYRNFESNVLWLQKGRKSNFPHIDNKFF